MFSPLVDSFLSGFNLKIYEQNFDENAVVTLEQPVADQSQMQTTALFDHN